MDKILTIIIPSYNMECYLVRSLESLMIDSPELLRSLDVIVVNDGSTDRTSEIAHEFEEEYPGVVRVIDKPNGHYGSCINTGLALAEGLYVKILDADDWFDTPSLRFVVSTLRQFILAGENIDMVLTNLDEVNEDGKVTAAIRYSFPVDTIFGLNEVLKKCSVLRMHAIIYRTAVLRDMKYYQTEGMLYTDGEWAAIPISKIKTISFQPCSLYKYLIGREGQSIAQYTKNVWMLEHLLKKVCEYYALGEMNPDVVEYSQRFIRITARKIYVIWLLKKPLHEVNTGLLKFDTEFRRLSVECYGLVKFPVLTFLKKGGIDFIARWRRKQYLTWFECVFLRLYVWLHG